MFIEEYVETPRADYAPSIPRLDLGSGARPRDGYIGVDKHAKPNVLAWNLAKTPWPWATESIEALCSSHLIEHLTLQDEHGRDVLVRFFEEAWRICKPGALFHLRWPMPFHPHTGLPVQSAWWDPTHYRHIPHEQLDYFSVEGRARLGVSYGFRCNWVLTREVVGRTLTSDGSVHEYDAELRREPL